MIKNSFIKKQIEKSKRERRTSDFLRRLIFFVVEKSLIEHYGDDYSMKCLQSSVVISKILNDLGIKSREFVGAVCVSQVFKDSTRLPSWNGFWGEDHHAWTITEYGEVVDLTISALHAHPMSKEYNQVPMPPVWWGDTEHWPQILRYLPEGAVKLDLPENDAEDLEEFTARVLKELEQTLHNKSVDEVEYSPILHGIDALNKLHESGHPWLRGSYVLQEANIPHPPWVAERERQLMSEYSAKNQT
ncbi:hypothetical protein SAMN04488073_0110 [Marinobacter gudaonensis]|uniref:Uncharacterized protein n=1 Tax=Marinobacter gudaonensis TaxID=375760 RepID=A0A1I6G732_9GAMM|nr:hypothetical protein [Marinobacter gudaonensis]SFR37995.1 hypothetical protein SAMN04488073_0110 [Marinobacter gudaonensis]